MMYLIVWGMTNGSMVAHFSFSHYDILGKFWKMSQYSYMKNRNQFVMLLFTNLRFYHFILWATLSNSIVVHFSIMTFFTFWKKSQISDMKKNVNSFSSFLYKSFHLTFKSLRYVKQFCGSTFFIWVLQYPCEILESITSITIYASSLELEVIWFSGFLNDLMGQLG